MILKKTALAFALLPVLIFGGCKKDKDPVVTTPMVVSSTPVNNATGVSSSANIEFSFSEDMDAQTINSTTVNFAQGNTVESGTVTYNNKKVTLTPSAAFAKGTVYTAMVSKNVMSAAGESLKADYKITFTTEDASGDVTAPLIISTSPLLNATGVARNKTVSIEFSEAMNASTISNSTFTLKNGSAAVAGVVAYAGVTATFTLAEVLEPNTVYAVKITSGAQDISGNALASDYSWNFTTSNTSSSLATVDLGGASNYLILAKTAINNSSTSALVGHLGLSPAATSYITGLALVNATGYATSSQVTGFVYAADMADPTPATLTTAVNDMITAYNDAAGRPTPDFLEYGTGNIGGKTLTAGLYKWTSTVTIPADLVLSGSATDIWIFQISGDLSQSSDINVTLNGGALAKNIFWQVAGEATFGTNSHFEGNILSMTGITFLTGASMNGRALAQTAVILDANALTKAQ